ncbi:TonB-dependent receptor domain-containing protein [Microbulbifer sp.]|uniref:TonB-dependent receptor domain-containing protein n=1 Tax=Microbulbifer sp. TaxID=1908541 RepID=UPI003F37AC6E
MASYRRFPLKFAPTAGDQRNSYRIEESIRSGHANIDGALDIRDNLASGGNPNLEPFEARQYDATLEWYPREGTALTAGIFYKDISTFIQTQVSDLEFNGEVYRLTSKVNGSNADVFGTNSLATENNAEFGSLDFSASYDINDAASVFMEGINIANEVQQLFVDDDEFRSYTDYGRTFVLGARIDY